MTPKQEAALRQALDCVSTLANARDWVGCTPNERWDEDEMYAELCNATICLKKSLSIIQEALAEQPAQQQEPVAWYDAEKDCAYTLADCEGRAQDDLEPLYLAPPSKPWVGLTDEEMREIYKRTDWDMAGGWEYERAIEAKLREKNT